MRTTRSLRANLAVTYAGIAALTALLLGAILLSVLGGYYARAEQNYLQAGSRRVLGQGLPAVSTPPAQLQRWVVGAAIAAQARVQLYADDGTLLADSGSLEDLDPEQFLGRPERGRGDREGLPRPLGEGFIGRSDSPPSSRTLQVNPGPGRAYGGYLVFSEAPASGTDALRSVGQAWTFAALLAVALAALAGYLVSSRMSKPIVALTEASDRMADGDLAARAPVTRDDELGRLAESFNTMAGRMENTVVALRRFVADAAHEIGTPLTALQADLELAEQAAVGEDERRLVARALGQARRIEGLSGDLLRLSRLETGDAPGEVTAVDVAQLAAEVAESFASRAEAAGIDFAVEVDVRPLPVLAVRSELVTGLGNLLDNAIKFTPDGGSITLGVAVEGDHASVTVADTGVGIPAAEREQVFSRFHRARNVAAYPGSGLGLAITRAAVERAGGTVTFVSDKTGTAFTVRLPLANG